MVERFRYRITTQSRVSAATTGEILHHTPMHDVLPGATLRGALAALWWLGATERTEGPAEFAALFDMELAVNQAVPIGEGDGGDTTMRLNSASTFFCKYPEARKGCSEFYLDMAQVVASRRDSAEAQCPRCGGLTKADPGWKRSYTTTRTTRTRLNADGTAAEGDLFRREAMPKGLVLEGSLWAPAEVRDWIDGAHLRIGGKRSVMGGCTIVLEVDPEGEIGEPGELTALRLRSPAIIVDKWGAASLDEPDWLAELSRVSGDELVLMQAWTRSERVTGWHMRSALPKPADWALAAGSTIVVEGLTSEGWSRLSRGIGLRTIEGYGELEILPAKEPIPGSLVVAKTPLEIAFDTIAGAIAQPDSSAVMRSAQGALREIRVARQKKYVSPEPTIAKHKKNRWFVALPAGAKSSLSDLFESELLDQNDFLDQFDRLINRLAKQERQK